MSSVPDMTSVRCSKMKTRHTSYASFHVVIPADQCHLVDSEGAWPEGSFVKIFSGRLLPSFVLESFDSSAPLTAPVGKGKPKEPKKTATTSNKAPSNRQPKPPVVNSPRSDGSGGRLSTGSTFSPLSSAPSGGRANVSGNSTGANKRTDKVPTSPKNSRPVRSGTKKV
uniref:Uncharacterized protein n=1 Tax=Cacopsylla melanoneura TaxID=428564 RepID=A0A8D8TYR6_9HEMI